MDRFLYVTVAVICTLQLCDAAKFNCTVAELEKHLAPILGIFGMRGVKFPENKAELADTCRIQTRADRMAKEYSSQCLPGLSSTIMTVTLYTANRMNKQYCAKLSDSALEMGPCGNRGKKRTTKCWNELIDALYVIKNLNDTKLKLPLVCCNFYTWKTCTVDAYKTIGPPLCTEKAVAALDERISRGSIDALNVICGDYSDDSDKCDKLVETMPELLRQRKGARAHKTPFMYLFDIYDNL